jgi:hypothetical protein
VAQAWTSFPASLDGSLKDVEDPHYQGHQGRYQDFAVHLPGGLLPLLDTATEGGA